jgi:uncharacterized membrane protein
LLWAAAPSLVLYAFHNWDLLVVALAVIGFWLWFRKNPVAAAVAFGIGGAFKLYPLLFLIPLALDVSNDLRARVKTFAVGIGTFAAINLPLIVVNPAGWWLTYSFHRDRVQNYDSIWTWLPSGFPGLTVRALNLTSFVLMMAFGTLVVFVALRRAVRESAPFPMVQTAGAILCVFLLWNKVHSPQYALWLLPFFVLLNVHVLWWVAYEVADLLVYVGVFRYFSEFGEGIEGVTLAQATMVTGIWLRAALLLALIFVFLRARSSIAGVAPTTSLSQPSTNL